MSERFQSTVYASPMVARMRRWLLNSGAGRWVFAVILGVGLGLIGPYGTFVAMPQAMRLAYWIALVLVSFAIWWGLEGALGKFIPNRSLLLEQVLVIVPFSALNSAFLAAFHIQLNAYARVSIPTSWSYYFFGHLVLSGLVIAPLILLSHALITQVKTQASSDTLDLLNRALPPALRGQTPLALGAEGHYVRVYTALGDALVTMRFEDAVAALAGVPGAQSHRSWWVAVERIVELQSVGSAFQAKLDTGMTVPVSRRRKAIVARSLTEREQTNP